MAYVALLAAGGLVLFIFEMLIPYPVPWMRLGLGNAATLIALFLFGPRDALLVTLIRTIAGSLIVGRLFTPWFLFSFCGGLASLGVMFLIFEFFYAQFSPVGISIFGAVAHNSAQLAVLYLLWVRKGEVLVFLPMSIFSSVITGFFIGVLACLVLQKVSAFGFFPAAELKAPE